jgi:hypothetical protein
LFGPNYVKTKELGGIRQRMINKPIIDLRNSRF